MAYMETRNFNPENFVAGTYPIATDTEHSAGEDGIRMYAPVVMTDGKIRKVTSAEALTGLYGIAMNDADTGEPVVVWCTGEFFRDALVLEDGVTADALIQPMRNIGIFLKS